MLPSQAAVVQDAPAIGRYVYGSIFDPNPAVLRVCLTRLASLVDGAQVPVGLRSPMPPLTGLQVGLDDGVVDALVGLSQPVTGANVWCPPVHPGWLNARLLVL